MPKRKVARIVPLGRAPSVSAKPVTSLKLARKLTSKFHELQNEETRLASDSAVTAADKAKRLAEIAAEMKGMGGREAYQEDRKSVV